MVAPIERVKIIYQATNEHFSLSKFPKVLLDIFHKEGFVALWRGHSASVLRVVPYAGIQFMTYDYVKRRLSGRAESRASSLKFSETMLCGGTAAAVSTSATYPLDLARSRLAVTPHLQRSFIRFQVFRCLHSWYQHGGLPELYRGLVPSLLGVIPYGAIAFSTNESAKHFFHNYCNPDKEFGEGKGMNVWYKLLAGALAGIVAQTCTYPLEMTRRRMQTAGHVNVNASIESTYTTTPSSSVPCPIHKTSVAARQATGMVATISSLYNSHGWRVFFKGISLNWIKGPITVSISFTAFDMFKNILLYQHE